MKTNIFQLLSIFDESLPATNEEQGVYWLKAQREDGLSVVLSFSLYESYVDIIVRVNSEIVAASVSIENCSEIRVLDEERKCLEILHTDTPGRCFLALLSNSILDYNE